MKQLPILIITILIIGALSVMAKSRSGSNPAEDTRKADYIYLEALRARSQGKNDAAYSLLQRARELNSDDKT